MSMLSWWKKKFNTGFGVSSPNERRSLRSRRRSGSSYNSVATSIVRTDKGSLHTEFDSGNGSESKFQDRSVIQCCRTFVNWTNWILYGDQEHYSDDAIRDIKDFQDPRQLERLIKKISNYNPIENMQCLRVDIANNDVCATNNHVLLNNPVSSLEMIESCIKLLMSYRKNFSVDMDISAQKIYSGDISSILKFIWLTIVRFRLEAIAERQLFEMQRENSKESSSISGYNLLLQYCNAKLEKYKKANITHELFNFSKSWCTGVPLLCLVHNYANNELPGLTQYIMSSQISEDSSSSTIIDTYGGSVSLRSFPNPPETEIKSRTFGDLDNSPTLESFYPDNDKSDPVRYVKYLLFSGQRNASKECVEIALRIAKDSLGVPAIISVEQMMEGNDELGMLTYLSEFFWITDISGGLPYPQEIENSESAGHIDKLMTNYAKEASDILDILLTLSTNHYAFVSIMQGEGQNSFIKSPYHKNDWFYPIIDCINDPHCSVEKLKYVSDKIIKTTDKIISEILSDAYDNDESQKSDTGRTKTFNIPYNTKVPQGLKDSLLFDSILKVTRLRRTYKDISCLVNNSKCNKEEISQTKESNDDNISTRSLSNLTFLHEQINRQLEEFLFGAFSDAKRALNNYTSFVIVSKAELDSLEEELTGRNCRIGGMLSEVTRIVSQIKELSTTEVTLDKKNDSTLTSNHDNQLMKVPQLKQTHTLMEKADVDDGTTSYMSCHTATIVKSADKSLQENDQVGIMSAKEDEYESDSKTKVLSGVYSRSSQNTLVGNSSTKSISHLCRECSEWLNSSRNSLSLIYLIVQIVYKELLAQINDRTPELVYKSSLERNLGKIYCNEMPKCCISTIINNISLNGGKETNNILSTFGKDHSRYLACMYSASPTKSERLTALTLTVQNMITRAGCIVDILKARFCSINGTKIRTNPTFYSSNSSNSPSAMFPKSIKEQVKKLINIAQIEIIQYLNDNAITLNVVKLAINESNVGSTNNYLTDTAVDCRLSEQTSPQEHDKTSFAFWNNIVAKVNHYCRKYILLEGQLKLYYTDLEVLGVEEHLCRLRSKRRGNFATEDLKDTEKTMGCSSFGIFSARKLVFELEDIPSAASNFNLSAYDIECGFSSLDDIWKEFTSVYASTHINNEKTRPHTSIKCLFDAVRSFSDHTFTETTYCNPPNVSTEPARDSQDLYNSTKMISLSNKFPANNDENIYPVKAKTDSLVDIETHKSNETDLRNDRPNLFDQEGTEQASMGIVCEDSETSPCKLITSSYGYKSAFDYPETTQTYDDKKVTDENFVTGNYCNVKDISDTIRDAETTEDAYFMYPEQPNTSGVMQQKLNYIVKEDLANSSYRYSHQGIDTEGDCISDYVESNNAIAHVIPRVDEISLSSLYKRAISRFDNIMRDNRRHFFLCEISLDEIGSLNTALCSFLEEVKAFCKSLSAEVMEICYKSNKDVLKPETSIDIYESSNSTLPIHFMYSMQAEVLPPTTYCIINSLCRYHEPLKSIYSRINPIYALLRNVTDILKCILEYESMYNKYDDSITEELRKFVDYISNTERGTTIHSELKTKIFNTIQCYLEEASERIGIKIRDLNNFYDTLLFSQEDIDVTNQIKKIIVYDLGRLLELEHRKKVKESTTLISNTKLVVRELCSLYAKTNTLIIILENDTSMEINISPPPNIISTEYESLLTTNSSFDEQNAALHDLGNLLQVPLIEKIDNDLIAESEARQIKRLKHYEELESVAQKVLNIADKFNKDTSDPIYSIAKYRTDNIFCDLTSLNNMASEIRVAMGDHAACMKQIWEIKDEILNEVSDIALYVEDLSDKMNIKDLSSSSVDTMLLFMSKLRVLIHRINNTNYLVERIKDKVIESSSPINSISSILIANKVKVPKFPANTEHTLRTAKLVESLLVSKVSSLRRCIISFACYAMYKYISAIEDTMFDEIRRGITEVSKEIQRDFYSDTSLTPNMEAYIPLNRIRSRSLLLKIIHINNQLSVIDKQIESSHLVYESWKQLMDKDIDTNHCDDYHTVNTKYRDIIGCYAAECVEFSNFYRISSIGIYLTDLISLAHNSLTLSNHHIQRVPPTEQDKLDQLVSVRLKILDHAIGSHLSLSNLLPSCSGIHILVYVSSAWICDRLVTTHSSPPESDPKTIAEAFKALDVSFDACRNNTQKINVVSCRTVNVMTTEKTHNVELCCKILQEVMNREMSERGSQAKSNNPNFRSIIKAIRLMGNVLYRSAKIFLRARNELCGHSFVAGAEDGFTFDVSRQVLTDSDKEKGEPASDRIMILCNSIEASFKYLFETTNIEFDRILDLLRCLSWAEDAIEMCVPGIRSLILQMEKHHYLNGTIDASCPPYSCSISYWAGMIGSWDSQIYQILNSDLIHRITQSFGDMNEEMEINPSEKYDSIDPYTHNNLSRVENQRSFLIEQEFVEKLKYLVESTLLYELQLLNRAYDSAEKMMGNTVWMGN